MRRIFITDDIQSLAEEYEKNLFSTRTAGFALPQDGLRQFEDDIRANNVVWNPNWADYANYVHFVRTHLKEIILLHPGDFDNYKTNNLNMLSDDQLKDATWKGGIRGQSFSDIIVEKMRYRAVRDKEILPYIEKLGIKTCVYCNSQYTATVHVGGTEIKGGYELDHYKPKDTYPFLCISFFNLQPCCGSCNRWKSNKSVRFNLYTDDKSEIISPFYFKLSDASIVRYMLSQDHRALEIKFGCQDTVLLANHEDRFHTTKLYENFRDTAEELVWINKSTNDVYKKQLVKQFVRLFPYHKQDISRFLYRFYQKDSEIHKRPLTKLQQDIAKQLHLI